MFRGGLLRRLDWPLLAIVFALCSFGLVMVYSATRAPEAVGLAPPSALVRRQVIWMMVGLLALSLTLLLTYEKLARWHVVWYAASLALLLAVLKVGKAPTGASSWIALGAFRLQPSEMAKIAAILSLAGFLSRRGEVVGRATGLLAAAALVAPVVLLVLAQPDFGTALVIVAIWFGVLAVAGARGKQLALTLVLGIGLFAGMWNLDRLPLDQTRPAFVGRILKSIALKDYQKRRLTAFLDPDADPLGDGYHVIQSRIGIGSGQLLGRGLFRGTQSRLRFLPERHTDFIFAVIGEELGLVGCLAVLALYFLLFWRGTRIVRRARDALGALIATGAVTMLTFHALVNIGMAVNLMPITGIPLPFISYGGSNLLASFIAVGLLESVHLSREKVLF